jgi:hypothetical protein
VCNAIDQRERILYFSGRQYCAHIGAHDVVCEYGQDWVRKSISVTGMGLVHGLCVVRALYHFGGIGGLFFAQCHD